MKKSVRIAAAAALFFATASSAGAHCIKNYIWMFTQPGCVYCGEARAFFERNGVQFVATQHFWGGTNWFAQEFSTADPRPRHWTVDGQSFDSTVFAYARWRFGFFGTPAFEIDGQNVLGFNVPLLRQLTCSYQ